MSVSLHRPFSPPSRFNVRNLVVHGLHESSFRSSPPSKILFHLLALNPREEKKVHCEKTFHYNKKEKAEKKGKKEREQSTAPQYVQLCWCACACACMPVSSFFLRLKILFICYSLRQPWFFIKKIIAFCFEFMG